MDGTTMQTNVYHSQMFVATARRGIGPTSAPSLSSHAASRATRTAMPAGAGNALLSLGRWKNAIVELQFIPSAESWTWTAYQEEHHDQPKIDTHQQGRNPHSNPHNRWHPPALTREMSKTTHRTGPNHAPQSPQPQPVQAPLTPQVMPEQPTQTPQQPNQQTQPSQPPICPLQINQDCARGFAQQH